MAIDIPTPADVNKFISYINRVPREAMNNQKLYDMPKLLIDKDAFKVIIFKKIPSILIVLTLDLRRK